ncbi:hypothetical protein MFIFM68171_07418 [Madurella fahalii]|uniref:Uncharacterized protein n=1 Tax=Madurella fahalii TaxID=1157608 RepID=A0ABQ0GHH1_9PEZI
MDNNIIACGALGNFTSLSSPVSREACCRLGDQYSPMCKRMFAPGSGLLDSACPGSPERCRLFHRCRSPATLYTSAEQNNQIGDGSLLLARYTACANIPALASLSSQRLLVPYIDQAVQKHLRLGPDESEFQYALEQITLFVTDCLASTCRRARGNGECYSHVCSPLDLVTNKTHPNVGGINDCLFNFCSAGTNALPWADADIVGIGVFSSYVMQCVLVAVLWVGLAVFSFRHARRGWPDRPSKASDVNSHFASWIDLLLEFHKAQCYFGGTLMIAVIVSNIMDIDFVITFLAIPLATNSILPVIFSYFLLVYYQASSPAITLLTAVVYLLSSVVYWILYARLPLPAGLTRGDMYRRYRLDVSSSAACGEYSGLAVCPADHSGSPEFSEGITARRDLRVLTPLIWTWSTFVFLAMLAYSAYMRVRRSRSNRSATQPAERPLPRWRRMAFWFTTLVFLVGVGMQVSVLSTAIKLDMVDTDGWSFGQVVAVTIWIPPLLEYVCGEISM